MVLLAAILFVIVLVFSKNERLPKSNLSKTRKVFGNILFAIAIIQVILFFKVGFPSDFIALFVGVWSWILLTPSLSTKGWRLILKVLLILVASFAYLASLNFKESSTPVLIESITLCCMAALQWNTNFFILALRRKFKLPTTDKSKSAVISTDNNTPKKHVSKHSKIAFYIIGGVVAFLILLPFIVWTVDKSIGLYSHYYYKITHMGRVEECDSVEVTEQVEVYNIQEEYNYFPMDTSVVYEEAPADY